MNLESCWIMLLHSTCLTSNSKRAISSRKIIFGFPFSSSFRFKSWGASAVGETMWNHVKPRAAHLMVTSNILRFFMPGLSPMAIGCDTPRQRLHLSGTAMVYITGSKEMCVRPKWANIAGCQKILKQTGTGSPQFNDGFNLLRAFESTSL